MPKDIYEYMNEKRRDKDKIPERLVDLGGEKWAVWIKRELKKTKSTNILDYPYLVLDPHNLLYPSYVCSWIDCKRFISLNHYVQGEK